jgi:hypothetical protein
MDLKLAACWNITTWVLLEISQLPQLHTLDLTSCNVRNLIKHIFDRSQITDDVIAQISHCCLYIKHLNLSGCMELTDLGLDNVTQALGKLETLFLAGNKGIKSFSCLHLPPSMLKIDLSNLDSSQIYFLSLQSLTELNLNNTLEIDDSSLQVKK